MASNREEMSSLPPLTKSSSPPDRDYSVPPSVRTRAEVCRGLVKRVREDLDPNEYLGRFQRAEAVHLTLDQTAGSTMWGLSSARLIGFFGKPRYCL